MLTIGLDAMEPSKTVPILHSTSSNYMLPKMRFGLLIEVDEAGKFHLTPEQTKLLDNLRKARPYTIRYE